MDKQIKVTYSEFVDGIEYLRNMFEIADFDNVQIKIDSSCFENRYLILSKYISSDKTVLGQIIHATYHIVYSSSFECPVLYFNISHQDGGLLKLDEIWKWVSQSYQSRLNLDPWTFITQQEHPILGVPYFGLHPCHTGSMLYQLKEPDKRKLMFKWITSVGPAVGLTIPVDCVPKQPSSTQSSERFLVSS